MKKLSSYEVSSMVDEIEQDVRSKYGLEDNWYGDYYPQEVLDLEINIRVCTDEEDLEYFKNELKELFELWGRDCANSNNEDN